MLKGNFFDFDADCALEAESFEDLVKGKGARIERIVSRGQRAPEGGGYFVQDWDEWVLLLSGEAHVELAQELVVLKSGDWVWIPAKAAHRVVYTSSEPPCVWCAVHLD
ncbi:MAG: cupin domain-containing protein [Bradymonadia bacterium]|jgi:cupin 2 domain-containing protein